MSKYKQISDIFSSYFPQTTSKSNPYKLEIWKKVAKGKDYFDECGRRYCIEDYIAGKTTGYISVRVVASNREVGRIPASDKGLSRVWGI